MHYITYHWTYLRSMNLYNLAACVKLPGVCSVCTTAIQAAVGGFCTGCFRRWYCSAECREFEFLRHRKACAATDHAIMGVDDQFYAAHTPIQELRQRANAIALSMGFDPVTFLVMCSANKFMNAAWTLAH